MGNVFCNSCSSCQEQNEISMDIMPALEGIQSMDHIEELIGYIDRILSNLGSGAQGPISKPTSVDSFINSGRDLTKTFSKRLNRHVYKKFLLSALDRRTIKVVSDVVSQAQPIPYVGMAFSIIGHLLERSDQFSSNDEHIISLLRSMCDLTKHMRNLGSRLDRSVLDDILPLIVKGTLMCALQMEPKTVCRFCFAPLDASELETFKSQLDQSYRNFTLDALTAISNTQPNVPGPSQGEYPVNAVAIEDARNKVNELLDVKNDSSRRVVIIYGVGGIGKTTLATAVFSLLDLSGYHHCKVYLDQDSKESDLGPKQEQILRDLFHENLKVNDWTHGRDKLSEAFGKASKPIFLFIDNALTHSNLEKLLPMEHLSRLPMQSRILLTTRNLNQTNIFELQDGVEVYSHRVDSVSEPEARRLLCHYALGDSNGSFNPDMNIEHLLQICGGIPLVLNIVGSQLRRRGNTVSTCNEILEYHKEWQQKGLEGGTDQLSERMVDFVYMQLTEPCKEAFLDIACFFWDWEQNKVGDIVGEMHLEDLERAALVTTSEEDAREMLSLNTWTKARKVVVKMHDIVRARGRKLSEGNRITDRESFSRLLSDEQKLRQIKGIWLRPSNNEYTVATSIWWQDDYEGEFVIEAKHVDSISRYLRVLCLGNRTRVNGRCERAFEELRFLFISYENILPIDLTKSRRLLYFRGWSREGQGLSQAMFNLPDSLRLLNFEADASSDPPLSLSLEHLTSLTELALSNITVVNFETCISQLKSLRFLQLNKCEGFTSIPENVGNFAFLKILDLRSISKLERLPESFGNLSSMKRLSLIDCTVLEKLPDSFGNHYSMQDLSIRACSMLKRLPETFGNLSSVQHLDMSWCSMLERLPESLGNLSSIQVLEMRRCSMLERLPESFGNLSSIQRLDMSECSTLERLPESFGNLSSIQRLEMSGCSMLERLPESFGNLSSIQCLDMNGCSLLERLPQTFDQLSCLQRLEMDGCLKMFNLPDNFGQLKCLKFLNIRNCKELKTLPSDIVCLTSLVALKAYGCAELEAKAMDSLVEIKSLMLLEMGESPMLIKRWEQIQQEDRPLIGAAFKFTSGYPYEEIMSAMLFSGGSRFVHVDGEGQLAEVESFREVGEKVGLLLTACEPSNEVRQKVEEVASRGYEVIYVDAGVEGEWEEREKRIREMLLQLPEGSRAWTPRHYKTNLLIAFSLWKFTKRTDTSIVGTSVVVDEDGRRKLSHPENVLEGRDGCDSRRVDFTTLFSPLNEAWSWMRFYFVLE